MGRRGLELARMLSCVALTLHDVGSSTPKDPGVNDLLSKCLFSLPLLNLPRTLSQHTPKHKETRRNTQDTHTNKQATNQLNTERNKQTMKHVDKQTTNKERTKHHDQTTKQPDEQPNGTTKHSNKQANKQTVKQT